MCRTPYERIKAGLLQISPWQKMKQKRAQVIKNKKLHLGDTEILESFYCWFLSLTFVTWLTFWTALFHSNYPASIFFVHFFNLMGFIDRHKAAVIFFYHTADHSSATHASLE